MLVLIILTVMALSGMVHYSNASAISPEISQTAMVRNVTMPVFQAKFVSSAECKALDSENCLTAPYSHYCLPGFLMFRCSRNATSMDVLSTVSKIKHLDRDRPVFVVLSSLLINFSTSLISPIGDQIVSLELENTGNQKSTIETLSQLHLLNLVALKLAFLEGLRIRKNDFDGFPKLRKLVFERCTFTLIEEGSFENLRVLRQMSLEAQGSHAEHEDRLAVRKQLFDLHCGCQYAWLRTFFAKRPYLLKNRLPGDLYNIAGYESLGTTTEYSKFFVPVECGESPRINLNQTAYSVNASCCSFEQPFSSKPPKSKFAISCNETFPQNSAGDAVLEDPDQVQVGAKEKETAALLISQQSNTVLYIIMLIVCIIANIPCVIVLAHTRPLDSVSIYLIVISTANLIAMCGHLPQFISDELGPGSAYNDYFTQWLIPTFESLSCWTLVIFSLERLYGILNPMTSRQNNTAKAAWIYCLVLFLLSGLFRMFSPLINYYRAVNEQRIATLSMHGNASDNANSASGSDFVAHRELHYWELYCVQIFAYIIVGVRIVNCLALFVINAAVIAALRRHQRTHNEPHFLGDDNGDRSKQQFRNSNIILITSNVFFLVTQLPYVVYMSIISYTVYASYLLSPELNIIVYTAIWCVKRANPAANCYLYLIVSKRFRADFVVVFKKYYRTFCEKITFGDIVLKPTRP